MPLPTGPRAPDPQSLAESCAAALWAEDFAKQGFGMEREAVGPGTAAPSNIIFLSPARLGDRLLATAEERHLAVRSGLYDIRVANRRSEVITALRRHSRAIGSVFFGA